MMNIPNCLYVVPCAFERCKPPSALLVNQLADFLAGANTFAHLLTDVVVLHTEVKQKLQSLMNFHHQHVPVFFLPSESLASLKSAIDESKQLKISAVRPLVLAAEENLHNMVVDLDKVISKVRT